MTSRHGGSGVFEQPGDGGDAEVQGRRDAGVIPVVGPPQTNDRLPVRPGYVADASLGGVFSNDPRGDSPTLQTGVGSPNMGASNTFGSGSVLSGGVTTAVTEFAFGNSHRLRVESKLGNGTSEFPGNNQGSSDYVAAVSGAAGVFQQVVTVIPVSPHVAARVTCRHTILSDVTAMWYGSGMHSFDVQEAVLHVTFVPEEQSSLMQQYASTDGRAEYLRFHSGELDSDVALNVAASKFKYRYCDDAFRRKYRDWLHARLGISCSFSDGYDNFSGYKTMKFRRDASDASIGGEPAAAKVYCNTCGFMVRAAGHAARCQQLVSATPVAKYRRWVNDARHTLDVREVVATLSIPFSEMDMMAQRFCNRDAQAKYLKSQEPSALPLYASAHTWADAFEERYEGAFRDAYLQYLHGVLKS